MDLIKERLTVDKEWFVDEHGRRVLLRGVNLGGSTKVPTCPDGSTHMPTDFRDHREVSFVGRPFALVEAEEHYSRLRKWGFNCLRFLTTWEAIEHEGPRRYDKAYLDYLEEVIQLAGEYGFYTFVDPHQDVWSRMTGGDGAPGWAFEKIGLDFTKFDETDAALVMQHRPNDYPLMAWSTNYQRSACATMFSLFFGGRHFAPKVRLNGSDVQSFFQDHFTESLAQVASRVKDMPHVIGFDSLNEPHPGFLGVQDLEDLPEVRLNLTFSPFQAMTTAAGHSLDVDIYGIKRFALRKVGSKRVNPHRTSVWTEEPLWADHGVWETRGDGTPRVVQADYFARNEEGERLDFFRDCMRPFIRGYSNRIREVIPETMVFVESDPFDPTAMSWDLRTDPTNVVNASHWYDAITLVTKQFRSWATVDSKSRKLVFRYKNIRKLFRSQLAQIKDVSRTVLGGVPTLIGEFGVPYDLDKKKSYRTGDFSQQEKALTLYHDLLDDLLLHSTLWNYTSDNNNQWGDLWNQEDLSIFSRDQQSNPEDLSSGGRAVNGFCRPYAQQTTGLPVTFFFDSKKKRVEYVFQANVSLVETELFIPHNHFPQPPEISVENGSFRLDFENQRLFVQAKKAGKVRVLIRPGH